jgi:HEAT repeat protein
MEFHVLRLLLHGKVLALLPALLLVTSCGTKPPYEGKSVAQLEEMLQSSETATQLQGAYGLSQRGAEAKPAVPRLIELLRSRHVLVRQNAVYALGKIGPAAAAAVPGLIRTLGDSDWRMRRQAALALGEIGPAARIAVADLQKLSGDLPVVRQAAADALAKIDPDHIAPKTP